MAHDESEERHFQPRLTTRIASRLRTDDMAHVAPTAIGDGAGRPDAPARRGRGG